MVVQVYRVFRTRLICVYERGLSHTAGYAIENAHTPLIKAMLDQPCIFTKDVIRRLADELASLPFSESLDNLIFILEAYPASSHHSAVPEIGILISIDGNCEINHKNLQRNWAYDHCYIVNKQGRTRWLLKHLPKQARHERDPK